MKLIEKQDSRDGWYEIPLSELAKIWEVRPTNRPVSEFRARRLADFMASGEWNLNGEPLIFDVKGNLLDGQHRIRAALISGVALRTYVVHVKGSVKAIFDSIDQNKVRTMADRFSIMGKKHYALLAAINRRSMAWEEGGFIQRSVVPSPERARKYLEKHRGEMEHAANTATLYKKDLRGLITLSTAGFVYCMAARVDKDRAKTFLEAIATGANLGARNPAMLLRKRLIEMQSAKSKLRARDVIALCIKAWSLFKDHKTVGVLRWRGVGDQAEQFPTF